MNQTRFYIVESRKQVVQVNLLLEGLPVQLSKEEYTDLLQEHLAIKSESTHIASPCCSFSRIKTDGIPQYSVLFSYTPEILLNISLEMEYS